MNYNLVEYMQGYLSHLKAVEMWLHAAHHTTKGPGFASDHKDLYGSMYTQIGDHFDILVEKSIALSGVEDVACPASLSLGTSHILNSHYATPVNLDAESIVAIAIKCIANLINLLSSLYKNFEKSGYLTLGMEDSLSSMSNEYEKFLYLLGQRYKN